MIIEARDGTNVTPVASLIASQAIVTNLARHSRGVDRNDLALMTSAYLPGATVTYGAFEGAAADFAAYLTGVMDGAPVTLHRTSNMWVRLDGDDAARSESYVIAYTRAPGEDGGGGIQRLIGGRYLDSHRKGAEGWRIAHRTYVLDWNINVPSREMAVVLESMTRGRQGQADPAQQMLQSFHARSFPEPATSGVSSMNPVNDPALDEALSKMALHDLRCAYARGVDRADEALLRSIFHEDAKVDVGVFKGSGGDFAHAMAQLVGSLGGTAHTVANEYDEVRGDHAVGESYALAYMAVPGEAAQETLVGGRYLDRYERRAGTWKIVERRFVGDWSMTQPSTREEGGMYEGLPLRGALFPNDPVYAFWASPPVTGG